MYNTLSTFLGAECSFVPSREGGVCFTRSVDRSSLPLQQRCQSRWTVLKGKWSTRWTWYASLVCLSLCLTMGLRIQMTTDQLRTVTVGSSMRTCKKGCLPNRWHRNREGSTHNIWHTWRSLRQKHVYYCIELIFRGSKFSWIAVFGNFILKNSQIRCRSRRWCKVSKSLFREWHRICENHKNLDLQNISAIQYLLCYYVPLSVSLFVCPSVSLSLFLTEFLFFSQVPPQLCLSAARVFSPICFTLQGVASHHNTEQGVLFLSLLLLLLLIIIIFTDTGRGHQ